MDTLTPSALLLKTPLPPAAAEIEILVNNINKAYSNHIGGIPPEILVVTNGLVRIWRIVEHEVQRIDNELTEALADHPGKLGGSACFDAIASKMPRNKPTATTSRNSASPT